MTNKKILAFILISTLILSPLLFVSKTAAKPKGSHIASELIEGKTDNEVREILDKVISTWQLGDDLTVKSEYEIYKLPRNAFTFDIESTMSDFKLKTKRTFSSFFLKPKNVHVPLHVTMNPTNETVQDLKKVEHINTDQTFDNAEQIASGLRTDTIPIAYLDENEIPFESISEVTINLDEIMNATLKLAIYDLHDQKIEANDSFSFIQDILYDTRSIDRNDEASFIAGKMYTLFLQTNFHIAERSIHHTTPSHSIPGFDVLIDVNENKDFVVVNPNDISFVFKVKELDNELTLSLSSAYLDFSYDISIREKEIQPRTVYRYSEDLEYGQEVVIQEGQPGKSVIMERLTFNKSEALSNTEFISHDIYTLIPTIILVSYKDEETAQEETIVEQVDEMEVTISDFESQIDEVRQEAASNSESSEQITSLTEQLESIQSQQTDFVSLVTALQEQMNANEGTSDISNDLYNKLAERLTKIDEQLKALKEKVIRFDSP